MTKPSPGAQGLRRSRMRAAIVTAASVALAAAAVVAMALGGISYYLGSVVVIACALVPFVASFEASRPQAREVALVAVLCALAVAARAAFFWLPHFKPMAALVMIAGMGLGPRSGFLVGAVSALVSNFLFGQGYWTPWQMLAFGLAGLAFGGLSRSGVAARCVSARAGRLGLAGAGAAFVMVVLGPLLDTSSVLLFLSRITPEGALAIYLAGVPVNAMHALATAVTLFVAAGPILSRIARVRRKFGLAER